MDGMSSGAHALIEQVYLIVREMDRERGWR
jgi:hypothetical protein